MAQYSRHSLLWVLHPRPRSQFNQPQILIRKSISGWLNPEMRNPRIWKVDCVLLKLISCFLLLFLNVPAAAAAKSLQSCPTLCDPIDGCPSGSPAPGILQARTLEWVAISFSNAGKWKVKAKCSVGYDSSRPHGLQPSRLLHPWDSPGKSTGVGCHCLLPMYLLA